MGSSSTPKYNQQKAQNEQVWAADQARKYGNVGVNSALGGYQWVTNPDGTQTIQTNLGDVGELQQSQAAAGLGAYNPNAMDYYSGVQNFNTSGTDAANAQYNMATRYLNQDFAKQQANTEADLIAKGIPVGSQAYNSTMQNLSDTQNRALAQAADQSVLSGQQYQSNALQNELARAQGLSGANLSSAQMANQLASSTYNPLSAIVQGLGGQFGGTYDQAYQAKLQAAQNKQSGLNSMIGTLGTIGGAALGTLLAPGAGTAAGAAAGGAIAK